MNHFYLTTFVTLSLVGGVFPFPMPSFTSDQPASKSVESVDQKIIPFATRRRPLVSGIATKRSLTDL